MRKNPNDPFPIIKWTLWILIVTFLSFGSFKEISERYTIRTLSFDFSCDRSGWLQIFFDQGAGFTEENSIRIFRHDHESSLIMIPIPGKDIRTLRIDPTTTKGTSFEISDIEIQDGWDRVKSTYQGKFALTSIAPVETDDSASIKGTATGNDPIIILEPWEDWQRTDKRLVWGILSLVVLGITVPTWILCRILRRSHIRTIVENSSIESLLFLTALLVFLILQRELIFDGFLSFLFKHRLDDEAVNEQVSFLFFLCLSWTTGYLFIRKRKSGFFPKIHVPKLPTSRNFSPKNVEPELLIILIVAFFLRGYFLAQPLRYDEAYTYSIFANRSWWDLFHYPLPNNHVLHTILVKVVTTLFGASEFTVRLPAFTFGVSNVILVYLIARKEFGKLPAIWASALQALCPYVILFDCMARGYPLFTFLLLLIIYLLQRWDFELTRGRIYVISVLMALGMYTIPSFLLPLTGVYLFILWNLFSKFRCYEAIKHSIASFSAFGILTFSFYAPVFLRTQSFSSFLNNKTVTNSHPELFFSHQLPHHLQKIAENIFRDIYPQFIAFLAILLLIGVIYHLIRRKSRLLNLLFFILAGALLVFLLKRTVPAPRIWLFALPILFIIQSYALKLPVFRRKPVAAATLMSISAASLLFSIDLVANQRISKYPNTGHLPNLKYALDYLYRNGAKPRNIRTKYFPYPMVLFYNQEFSKLIEEHSDSDTVYWILGKPANKIESFEDRDTQLVMQIGNCRVYEVLSDSHSQQPEGKSLP